MAQFKKGDRVRVLPGQGSSRFRAGQEFTVDEVFYDKIGLSGIANSGGWFNYRFELVTPEWKFVTASKVQAGDRIRATSKKYADNFAEFTVEKNNTYGVFSYETNFNPRDYTFERLTDPAKDALDAEQEKLRAQLAEAQAKVAELTKILDK